MYGFKVLETPECLLKHPGTYFEYMQKLHPVSKSAHLDEAIVSLITSGTI